MYQMIVKPKNKLTTNLESLAPAAKKVGGDIVFPRLRSGRGCPAPPTTSIQNLPLAKLPTGKTIAPWQPLESCLLSRVVQDMPLPASPSSRTHVSNDVQCHPPLERNSHYPSATPPHPPRRQQEAGTEPWSEPNVASVSRPHSRLTRGDIAPTNGQRTAMPFTKQKHESVEVTVTNGIISGGKFDRGI